MVKKKIQIAQFLEAQNKQIQKTRFKNCITKFDSKNGFENSKKCD